MRRNSPPAPIKEALVRAIRIPVLTILVLTVAILTSGPARAQVKLADVITMTNAVLVKRLLSPGNYLLVEHGMTLDIVPTEKLEWPPPYKAATEKYHAQVRLLPNVYSHAARSTK